MKLLVSGDILVEIVHGGSALEGRSLSCEIERNRRHEKERSERGERRKKRKKEREREIVGIKK